jgi:hypothetical protein
MIIKAQNRHLITGLAENLISKGMAALQYADDTILCLENNVQKDRYVKLLLYLYEQMSGLKINFKKSEILLIGGDNELASTYADVFDCQVSYFTVKYLGVPISASKLKVKDWAKMEEKSRKKLDIWQENSLSIAGGTTLINVSLTNSSIYYMSMFLMAKTVIDKLDKGRRKFFWQGGQLKKKNHLVR